MPKLSELPSVESVMYSICSWEFGDTGFPPPPAYIARPAAPPLLYGAVFQLTPSKNSSVPKSWLNLVVPASGAASLLLVSPREQQTYQ